MLVAVEGADRIPCTGRERERERERDMQGVQRETERERDMQGVQRGRVTQQSNTAYEGGQKMWNVLMMY